MSSFYTGLQNTADALLKDKGQLVTFKRLDGSFDPVEGEVVEVQETVQQLNAASLPMSTEKTKKFDNKRMEGLALHQMRFLIVSGKGADFIPQSGDTAEMENRTWSVMGCTPLNPNGQVNVIFYVGLAENGRVA